MVCDKESVENGSAVAPPSLSEAKTNVIAPSVVLGIYAGWRLIP